MYYTALPGVRDLHLCRPVRALELCHVCGEVINVKAVPHYLDVRDYRDAEEVVNQNSRTISISRDARS